MEELQIEMLAESWIEFNLAKSVELGAASKALGD